MHLIAPRRSSGSAYNPASQISGQSRDNDAYAWTGHGSGSTATVTDGLNRLVSVGGAGFTYDANGNVMSDGATSFTYDPENRLAAASGAKAATLGYDPLGRLAQVSSTATRRHLSRTGAIDHGITVTVTEMR